MKKEEGRLVDEMNKIKPENSKLTDDEWIAFQVDLIRRRRKQSILKYQSY